MTLVLSCITEDVVYQVSDRRLTFFQPAGKLMDDHTNKAVFVEGRAAFGYTGISQVNGMRTDNWLFDLVSRLGTPNVGTVVRGLRDEATKAFRRMHVATRYKRHAFQCVGWFLNNPANMSEFEPGILTIHNALDEQGEWLAYAQPEFAIREDFPKVRGNQFHLSMVGMSCSAGERAYVRSVMRKCAHRAQNRERAILAGLVHAIRWLSLRYEPNSPVGRNLMGLMVPKTAAEEVLTTGRASLTLDSVGFGASFFYYPEHGGGNVYGPHFVGCGGGFQHFTFVRGSPG